MSPDPELLSSIQDAALRGTQQEVLRREMLRFAHDHEDSLFRTCEAGHFTGSAVVVDDDRKHVLLMLHTKAGLWLQPGGHADGQADLAQVALREAKEETGMEGLRVVEPAIDLDIHMFRPRTGASHRHLDVRYLVLAPRDGKPIGNAESEQLRWVPFDDLAEYGVDDGLIRLARRGLELAATIS